MDMYIDHVNVHSLISVYIRLRLLSVNAFLCPTLQVATTNCVQG